MKLPIPSVENELCHVPSMAKNHNFGPLKAQILRSKLNPPRVMIGDDDLKQVTNLPAKSCTCFLSTGGNRRR
jgi:hypothetical protein